MNPFAAAEEHALRTYISILNWEWWGKEGRLIMEQESYCPITLKPCKSTLYYEKIADEFGVQVHPPVQVCTCHGEEVIDRRTALTEWWENRCRRENRKLRQRELREPVTGLHPLFSGIFAQHFGI